jgi:uncharacterized protein (TIGR02271 family)
MAVHLTDPSELYGAKVLGNDGSKLGKVEGVYSDIATGRPEWAAVKSGFFGTDVSLVPLATAEFDGSTLMIPYNKAQLERAPRRDPWQELSPQDEAELFSYYGVGQPAARGPDTSGSDTDTDDAMTRSEERLRVGTETRPAGKVRLRKHVVTEQQQITVPVSHEEVRVEREPITEANRDKAMSGPPISEAEHEVTLHEERPVVEKEVHPVERVRLDTETVTEQRQVGGEVRKEEINIEDERDRK